MTVRTAICVLVVASSTVWAQNPAATIKNVQKQAKGSTSTTEKSRQNPAAQTSASAGKKQSAAAATTGTMKSSPKAVTSRTPTAAAQKTTAKPESQSAAKAQKKRSPEAESAKAQPKGNEQKPAEKPKEASAESAEKGQKAESTESENNPESSEQQVAATMRGRRDPFQTVIRPEAVSHCTTGKKCLVVDKMDLKGVVRSQNGMIAVVENQQKKTYFLHENDPIFNGHVVKINPDSVLFRETVTDRVGRQSTRDVVKRIITGPSV